MGGGQRQIASLYINNNGTRKALNSAYANINGASKQIFTRLYTWAKYTWSTDGVKSYNFGSGHDDSTNCSSTVIDYLFSSCLPIDNFTYRLSNETPFGIKCRSNSFIDTVLIGSTTYDVMSTSSWNDENRHLLDKGIYYKRVANVQWLYFTSTFYIDYFEQNRYWPGTGVSDPCTTASPKTPDYIYWNRGDNSYTLYYKYYDTPETKYLWKPNPIEYVASEDRNAYSENNTSINVNNSFSFSSSDSFPYNPTYRFIG